MREWDAVEARYGGALGGNGGESFYSWRMRSDPKLVRFRLGRTHSLGLSWFSFSLPGRPRRVIVSFLSSVALGRQGTYNPCRQRGSHVARYRSYPRHACAW